MLQDISFEEIVRVLGVGTPPLSAWCRNSLCLLARIRDIGMIGQHMDLLVQSRLPNRTAGWSAEPAVLEALVAFQGDLLSRLRSTLTLLLEADNGPTNR